MAKYSANTLSLTESGIERYRIDLGIDVERIRGSSILDIGACYATFQEQCKSQGMEVVAVDPLYAQPKNANKAFAKHMKNPENRKNKIAGINESLPFIGESFDEVVCNRSSLYYLRFNYPNTAVRKRMAKKMIKEIVRVLKPDGEAHIGEIRKGRGYDDRAFLEPIVKKISSKSKSDVIYRFVDKPSGGYLVIEKF